MFELSDYITGIYKSQDCTGSVTLTNSVPSTNLDVPMSQTASNVEDSSTSQNEIAVESNEDIELTCASPSSENLINQIPNESIESTSVSDTDPSLRMSLPLPLTASTAETGSSDATSLNTN